MRFRVILILHVAIKSEVQVVKAILLPKAITKGIDVIFEQPISEREYAELYGVARKINVILQFAIYIVDCHQYKILSKIIKS